VSQRESHTSHRVSAEPPQPVFGWRPSIDDEQPIAAPSPAAPPPSAIGGNGVQPPVETPAANEPAARPSMPVPAHATTPTVRPRPHTIITRHPPMPPAPPATLRTALQRPTWLGHLVLLAIIVTIIAGHGFWNRMAPTPTPAPAPAGNTEQLGDLQTMLTGSTTLTTAAGSVGGASGVDPLSGYFSVSSSPVIPNQLNIRIVTAEAGQTLADIARQTKRSVDTLLWANGMSDPLAPLPAGTPIRVPPVDGMLHIVHDGDTLASIAARYQVDISAITNYAPNGVQSDADLAPYKMIMVPGGKMPARTQVLLYTVRPGDTLATIAQYFGLRPETIIWANSLPDGDLIYPGQRLAILPTDGVMVQVKDGDTVESLAQKYGVTPDVIRNYPLNGLGNNGQLRVGQLVMIPGGKPPAPPPPPPTPTPAPAPAAPAPAAAPAADNTTSSAPAPAVQTQPQRAQRGGATGHFIWPTQGTITQYFGPTSFWMEPPYQGYAHFHQGVDIANAMGTPIVAADGGRVIFAGWSTVGYGYAVAIDHGNGFVTWYGHMAGPPAVSVGQIVSQGQYLGPMGSTGASTGPHLHFGMMRNGVWVNPLDYLP